jgi:outer membrane protein|tara:strand:+ start:25242 stop:25775 length:534 start_codon:yes stop_codon:yes gene_type:complete
MTKLALPLAIIAIAASIFTFFSVQSSSELVYVDINKLIDGYKRTAVEKTKFEQKATQMQANVDSLIQGWQNDIKTYEKERISMTKKERELKQELLSNKQQQIGSYQQAIQKQIQEEDQKATQTVMNDINSYIQEFGKNNNYKIIFGASGSGNIMYADPASDLTEKVLEGLNADFKTN